MHLHHTLKNALIPIVTVAGLQLGYLPRGAILADLIDVAREFQALPIKPRRSHLASPD